MVCKFTPTCTSEDDRGIINKLFPPTDEIEIGRHAVNVLNHDPTSPEQPLLYNEYNEVWDNDTTIQFKLEELSGAKAIISVRSLHGVDDTGAILKMMNKIPSAYASSSEDIGPTLSLHTYSEDGKHVGMNYETGEYEVQILGAEASGLQPNGHEWIFVPKDIEVTFKVDSHANEEYLNEHPELEIDGVDSYTFVAVYDDETGTRHESQEIIQSIPPGVMIEHSVSYQENPDGTYTFDVNKQYDVSFLPPITTTDQFNLTNGRTLPIKFTARDNDTGEFIYDDTVNVTITNSTGHLIALFTNGTGTDSVRINSIEEQYIVNFHTKNYDLNVRETYTIHVAFGEADAMQGYAMTHFTLVDRKH